jgi:hypothetical protein
MLRLMKQEKIKDATLGKLNDLVADTGCQAGASGCDVEPEGSACRDFLAKYR